MPVHLHHVGKDIMMHVGKGYHDANSYIQIHVQIHAHSKMYIKNNTHILAVTYIHTIYILIHSHKCTYIHIEIDKCSLMLFVCMLYVCYLYVVSVLVCGLYHHQVVCVCIVCMLHHVLVLSTRKVVRRIDSDTYNRYNIHTEYIQH